MRPLSFFALSLVLGSSLAAGWVPTTLPPLAKNGPTLCPGAYLTPEEGHAVLQEARAAFSTKTAWEKYADGARAQIQASAGLAPFPRRTPLNPIVRSRRSFDGYTVENVAFESVPGYFVCGNLYRPAKSEGPSPVVLSLHGHSRPVVTEDDLVQQGRFTPWMQARCATLARLGAVVLSIEMVGYGESAEQFGQSAHKRPFSVTLQTWNASRALDYLLSLRGVDPSRVAVSGESGGGTQTILITALDKRVTISAPVVMVSSYFFGGCECESGLPIHRSAGHFASNVLISALAAPRPQLLVSDGDDWTQHTAESEYPFLQHIYGLYDAKAAVENVHLPREKHDYGASKRIAFYNFVAKQFRLSPLGKSGKPLEAEESSVTIELPKDLRVFTADTPRPAHALKAIADVEAALHALQR